MSTFQAIIGGEKYDPNTDPEKPKIGDIIPNSDLKIAKVEYISASELMAQVIQKITPDKGVHENVMVYEHPTRPFVKYLVWVDKISQ
jgi:hypothetical protein